jgi:hypothetical protein
MNNKIELTGTTYYHTSYPPSGAKKGYVAKITGRAAGAVKYEREFLGDRATILEGDEGLYERQIGEKKGGYTRYYHVVLSHPEHGLICSVDCEDILPAIAKALDAGVSIQDAVEVTNLRPGKRTEGLWVFDAVARDLRAAKKAAANADVGDRVAAVLAALDGLDPTEASKVLSAAKKSLTS